MKLQEVFDQLSAGELSQVSIGGKDAGVIEESNWPKMVSHINLGLGAIYKRFPLKEGRVKFVFIQGQWVYTLHSDYSIHSVKRPTEAKFILDTTTAKFTNDIQKIERVLTDAGLDMPLNDASRMYSVSTPKLTTLRVPEVIVTGSVDLPDEAKTTGLEVVYRASHPKIVIPIGYFDPEQVELELPDTHLEALLLFVAGRVHTPMTMSDQGQAANNYHQLFELECQRLEQNGFRPDQGQDSSRLVRNGWV